MKKIYWIRIEARSSGYKTLGKMKFMYLHVFIWSYFHTFAYITGLGDNSTFVGGRENLRKVEIEGVEERS